MRKFSQIKEGALLGTDEDAKPRLKCQVLVAYKVDWHDLEDFARKIYKFENEYDFVANQECSNDSSHEFNITNQLDTWTVKEAEEIRKGIAPRHNYVLLKTLCADGYIEPGKYIIRVSW